MHGTNVKMRETLETQVMEETKTHLMFSKLFPKMMLLVR